MKYIILSLLFVFPALGNDLTFDKESGKALPNYLRQLKIVKGKVYKQKPQGKPLPVEIGERFYKNETLVTENKSFAKFQIVDDTELNIGPNSQLNFEEFKFVSKTDRKILYSLLKGQLSGHVKNKANEGDIVFKTKNATLGVRGTQIVINHQVLKNLEISEFALKEGSATVTDQIKEKKHDLLKDQRLIVLKDIITDESVNEQNLLSPNEVELLKGEDAFLPYFVPHDVQPGSTLYGFLNKKNEVLEDKNQEKKEAEPTGSFHNLKKLNEKLKEEQQN